MDYCDFLDSAENIVKGCRTGSVRRSEADWRNAISRAYYTSYHACVNTVIQEDLLNERDCNHQKVIDALLGAPDEELREIGLKLGQAKKERHKADYRLNKRLHYRDANAQIMKVKNILNLLKEHNAEKSA